MQAQRISPATAGIGCHLFPDYYKGIVSDVYLSVTGGVVISDPWVRTELPSKSKSRIIAEPEFE